MTENTQKPLETWAIVEIMGRQIYAGYLTEHVIGGTAFLRVDVPTGSNGTPAFTKLFGAASIYCITPCDETTALAAVNSNNVKAFDAYSVQNMRAAIANMQTSLGVPFRQGDDNDNEEEKEDIDDGEF